MDNREFLSELERNENRETIECYKQFQKYQKAAWDTLVEFDRVCRKNRIKYQLSFGSLIGAVRDGGQIPWDYDIDVLVGYKDRLALVEALNKDLSNQYYFVSSDNNKKCRNNILRVTPNGYNSAHLHVDVFFLIGLPENESDRIEFQKRVKEISNIKFAKKIKFCDIVSHGIRYTLEMLVQKIKVAFVCWKPLEKEYIDLCNKYPLYEFSYCTTADLFATDYQIPVEYFINTSELVVDGKEFPIPKNYEGFLKLIYGNYLTVPPYRNRVNEFKKFYNLISKDFK